jgi:hypothetical protein
MEDNNTASLVVGHLESTEFLQKNQYSQAIVTNP